MPQDEEQETLPPWLEKDRKRGILTPADREFLLPGENEIDKQSIRDKRYRIRERIKNALLDFNLLLNISEEDRKKVFGEIRSEGGPTIQNTLGFFYLGITDIDYDDQSSLNVFTHLLTAAIEENERTDRGFISDAEVTIEIDRSQPEPSELIPELVSGEATMDEFLYIMESGEQEKLFSTVAKRDEPLTVKMGPDNEEVELLDADRAQEILTDIKEDETEE